MSEQRARIVAATTLVAVTAALAWLATADTVYRASTEVLVGPTPDGAVAATGAVPVDAGRALRNEQRFAEGAAVRRTAREVSGVEDVDVEVDAAEDADVLTFTAEGPTAERAARVANGYAQAYLEVRRQTRADQAQDAIATLRDELTRVDARLAEEGTGPEPEAPPFVGGAEPDQAGEAAALVAERDALRRQLEQVELWAGMLGAPADHVLRTATPPDAPVSPRRVRTLAVALAAGVLVGASVAVTWERANRAVRSPDDLARLTASPPLGRLPGVPGPGTAQAHQRLVAGVTRHALSGGLRALLVARVDADEDAPAAVAALAVSLAGAGELVAAVDADLRRPGLHHVFGAPNGPGLGAVLAGRAELANVVQPVEGDDFELFLVPSGTAGRDPRALLAGPELREVVALLRHDADVVLVNAASVLDDEGAAVARVVDGAVVVGWRGRTSREAARRAAGELTGAGVAVVGSVLVDTERRTWRTAAERLRRAGGTARRTARRLPGVRRLEPRFR